MHKFLFHLQKLGNKENYTNCAWISDIPSMMLDDSDCTNICPGGHICGGVDRKMGLYKLGRFGDTVTILYHPYISKYKEKSINQNNLSNSILALFLQSLA